MDINQGGGGVKPTESVRSDEIENGGNQTGRVKDAMAKVFARSLNHFAPNAKSLLGRCLLGNIDRPEPAPAHETLQVHIEAIGSGVVLIPRLDIRLDDERSMYDVITQDPTVKKRLDIPNYLYVFLNNGELSDLDMKPRDFLFNGEIRLSVVRMENLPGKREALQSVRKNGMKLANQAPPLKADKDVVFAAVRSDGRALKYAAAALQADKEVVLAAVSNNADALEYAPRVFRRDKEIILAATRTNEGEGFKYANPVLEADKDLVLSAVRIGGGALRYAAAELKADKEVVLAAVSKNGWALKDAAAELQRDREVVITAIRSDIMEFNKSIKKQKSNLGNISWKIRYNRENFAEIANKIQVDKESVLSAIRSYFMACNKAAEEFKEDIDSGVAAIIRSGEDFLTALEELENR